MTEGRGSRKFVFIGGTLLIILVTGFLFYRYLAPFGKIVTYQFTSKLPGSQERMTFPAVNGNAIKIPSQILKNEQSRFSLNLPSSGIESIRTILRFKNQVKEITLGLRGDEKSNFFFVPLFNSPIQTSGWEKISENGLTLWQRTKKFNTIRTFLNELPIDSSLYYLVNPDRLNFLTNQPNTLPGNATSVITTSLRGTHNFVVKVTQKPLIIKVQKQDLNMYKGEDKVKISVSKNGNVIQEKTILDDGITDGSGLKLLPQETTMSIDNVTSGIYQIAITNEGDSADSLIKKLEVNQPDLVVKDSVFILDSRPTTLWTNTRTVQAITYHDTAIQTVQLNDIRELKISKKDTAFNFNLEGLVDRQGRPDPFKLTIPKSDIVFQGDGYFAFSPNAFPESEANSVNNFKNIENLDKINYILSSYSPITTDGNWSVSDITLTGDDLKSIVVGPEKKLYLSLEVPNLQEFGGELEIDSLEIQVKTKGALETATDVTDQKSAKPSKNDLIFSVKDTLGNLAHSLVSKIQTIWPFKPKAKAPVVKPTAPPLQTPTTKVGVTPVAQPSTQNFNIPIQIMNAGAIEGAAGKFAESLKGAGFVNVKTGNTNNKSKNAAVRALPINKDTVEKIAQLLSRDYTIIVREISATASGDITVILGEK